MRISAFLSIHVIVMVWAFSFSGGHLFRLSRSRDSPVPPRRYAAIVFKTWPAPPFRLLPQVAATHRTVTSRSSDSLRSHGAGPSRNGSSGSLESLHGFIAEASRSQAQDELDVVTKGG
jgi:hypothetical protein